MNENITIYETNILIFLTFGTPIVVLIIFSLLRKLKYKKKNEIAKKITFEDYLGLCFVLVTTSFLIYFLLGNVIFGTKERIQEVQEAKIEAIAKKIHVSEKEIQLKEKDYRVEKDSRTERVYEVKTKDQTLEVVLHHEAFKQYHVVKISKVLEEENMFTR